MRSAGAASAASWIRRSCSFANFLIETSCATAGVAAILDGEESTRHRSDPHADCRIRQAFLAARQAVLVIERLAWVTARGARGLDEDEPIALAALGRTGVAVDVVEWDDPGVRWCGYDRVVLRSSWDYTQHLPEFLAWLDAVDAVSELVNPAATVRWNLDKQYLAALAADGVPITPTAFVRPGEAAEFPDGAFVVKPAVGAGSRDAPWYRPDERASASTHVTRLHAAGQTVLVQPMLASVARDGEWPLVFFGGTFSHAANKRVHLPRAEAIATLFAPEANAPHVATPEQVGAAAAAVDAVSRRLGTP